MGYVYLICDPSQNTYKIGVTRNIVQKRLKKLQTGNSSELHIVNTVETKYPFRLETLLHNKYKHKKVYGEWYNLSDDEVKSFKSTCDNLINIMDSMSDNPFFMKSIK